MRAWLKEELLKFDGTSSISEASRLTANYELSQWRMLYERVKTMCREGMN